MEILKREFIKEKCCNNVPSRSIIVELKVNFTKKTGYPIFFLSLSVACAGLNSRGGEPN